MVLSCVYSERLLLVFSQTGLSLFTLVTLLSVSPETFFHPKFTIVCVSLDADIFSPIITPHLQGLGYAPSIFFFIL
jgi:hypothetical protein